MRKNRSEGVSVVKYAQRALGGRANDVTRQHAMLAHSRAPDDVPRGLRRKNTDLMNSSARRSGLTLKQRVGHPRWPPGVERSWRTFCPGDERATSQTGEGLS